MNLARLECKRIDFCGVVSHKEGNYKPTILNIVFKRSTINEENNQEFSTTLMRLR